MFLVECMDEILFRLSNLSCDISNKTNEKKVHELLQDFLQETTTKNIQNGEYIKHPNGKQRFPDFLLRINNEFYNIECKSSKTSYKPMWNCSFPKSDNKTIYVFTNRKENKTILFSGNEVITPELSIVLERYKNKTKQLEFEFNKELSMLTKKENPYDIRVYARNMFVQKINFSKMKKFFSIKA